VIGVSPLQLPGEALSVAPTVADPERVGGDEFVGGAVVLEELAAPSVVDADPIATELARPAPTTNARPNACTTRVRMRDDAGRPRRNRERLIVDLLR
jgi:hypothetical protein